MLIANEKDGHRANDFRSKAKDYVVVELAYDSGVSISPAGFHAPSRSEKRGTTLNSVLEGFKVKSVGSHFGVSKSKLRQRSVAAPTAMPKQVSTEFAQSGVMQILPSKAADCEALVKKLNGLNSVWKAYVAPRPVPAAIATPNMEPAQGYLCSAPNGINSFVAWEYDGGQGDGIAVCDIEGDWNFKHDDLPSITHFGGELLGGDWIDHGTAVLGEIVGKPGKGGVCGIAPKAKPKVHSHLIGGLFNTAQAITNSADRLNAGDVLLIELQGDHPITGQFVAMQYWDDTFSAIRAAVEKGIVVVEAAGNGDQNFDAKVFKHSNLQKDAGAIVVGAGVPPTNYYDYNQGDEFRYTKMGTPRSRTWFSNYGKIVNVQGWGEHVTTTGYGDAFDGGNENRWYTHRFSGTSSASPIVTGAVACLQGIAKAGWGDVFSPSEMRKLLIDTGTPQADDPVRPKTQHIGPQPNLEKAISKFS